MKRILLPILLVLLLAPTAAGQRVGPFAEPSVVVPSPSRGTSIIGPDTQEVGDWDIYSVDGPTSNVYEWLVIPSGGTKFAPIFLDRGRDGDQPVFAPGAIFGARQRGVYTLLFIDYGRATTHRIDVTVGEGPEPEPDPDPDPEPDPNPQPAVFCVIIEERSDRDDITPQRAMVFESKTVRDLFDEGAFQVRDDDVLDETGKTPPDIKPYVDRARKLGLPAMFLVDENGSVIFEGPVPKDVPAALELIGGYLE